MRSLILMVLTFLILTVEGAAGLLVTWAEVEGAVGYNLYRATPNIDSPYIKLNPESMLILETSWNDETVCGLTRYFYIAEALDGDWNVIQTSNPQCIVHVCHGDANLSNTITVSDAALISQHIAGLVTLEGLALKAADANLDGHVSVSDVTRIHQHIAGINPLEHCEVCEP